MLGFALGDFPLGGFPLSDSLSVSDPLPGLLADPAQPREFLLRTSHGVDLSSSGYTSLSSDSPYKLFLGAIGRPYNFNVELPSPDLKGGSTLGVGELRINNPDGLRDSDALLDWLGKDADVYIGRSTDALTSFTRFFRGKSAGVSWDLNSFSVLHRDLRFKLQQRLQKNRYMGLESCLRLSLSTDQISYGDILDPSSTDNFTVEIMFRSTDTTNNKTLFSKKAAGGATNPGWRVVVAANAFFADIADGVNTVTGTATAVPFLDGKLHRATFIIDRTNQIFTFLVDGVIVITSSSISAVGSLASTQPILAGNRGSGSQGWIGDLDDFRYWTTTRTQLQVQGDMFREIAPQTNLAIYSKYNESSGTTAGDSSGFGRTGTITGATWVGSLEGDSSLSGQPKPVLLGFKRYITPKLVDPQRLVYQWHDGTGQGCDAVQDGGDPYTFASDVTDIYSVTPSAGTFTTSNVNGLFRLGSNPVGVITCTCRGDNSLTGYVDNTADIHYRLATKYGGLSSSDTNLDTYAILKSKANFTVGFYYSDEITVDVAMDDCVKMGADAWWSPDRVAKVSVGRIDDPSTLVTDIYITQDDIVDPALGGVFQNNPVGVRIGQVKLGYRRYGTTFSDDQVAGTLSLSVRKDLGEEYRYVTSTVPVSSSDSDTLTVYTEIDDPIIAQAEADRLRDLWKVDRRAQRLSLDSGLLSYFIGTVFQVQLSRYDLTAGKKYILFGITEDMGEYGQPDRLEVLLFS